ncbi:MAG: RNA 2'-phosphotransferase [Bacteroidetes bacterium]|nr:RNA 2'-phosphotransferase [Bacteroidota bacterium]
MKDIKEISKFLSLVLRHQPEKIGITMDANGWVNVDELIQKCARRKQFFDFEKLEEVVATNDKQRFAFNEDYTKIRANQGHSVKIDLLLQPTEPLEYLYHGTVDKFMAAIKVEGLQKMSRTHVHLSKDLETAIKVGSRRGKPIILTIRAGEMHRNGHLFYLSGNGVWLCDNVPAQYIEFKS